MDANRADALHRAGRSREGLAVAIAAEADLPAGSRAARWLAMQRAEIEFALGEWDAAEAHLPHRGRLTGTTLAYFNLTRAGLLLGRGDTRAARPLLEETARILALSLEPQYLAGSGALRGELERREGDLDAARAVVEEAIDRIEFCSEDGERLAEVACVGVRVEADAAERARDLGDEEAERGARLRAEMMRRARAGRRRRPRPAGPVRPRRQRRRGRRARRRRGRPGALRRRGRGVGGARAPVPRRPVAASPRPRRTCAPAIATPRSPPPAPRTPPPARLGARLARRARSRASPPAPACASTTRRPPPSRTADGEEEAAFGLTPRELQVLALLAGGATNREIGAQLFMAEKTASVHVSRILSKLDVRTAPRRPPSPTGTASRPRTERILRLRATLTD